MLGLMKYADATYFKKQPLNNIDTSYNMELRERKIDSALTDLIDLAADKEMRGKQWYSTIVWYGW